MHALILTSHCAKRNRHVLGRRIPLDHRTCSWLQALSQSVNTWILNFHRVLGAAARAGYSRRFLKL